MTKKKESVRQTLPTVAFETHPNRLSLPLVASSLPVCGGANKSGHFLSSSSHLRACGAGNLRLQNGPRRRRARYSARGRWQFANRYASSVSTAQPARTGSSPTTPSLSPKPRRIIFTRCFACSRFQTTECRFTTAGRQRLCCR